MKKNLKLVIGDQTLSSWSLRPWLALKASGLPFTEIKILLDRPETKKLIAQHSPTGKVPVLIDGSLTVWDSLAICEYIAELAPHKKLWPEDPHFRALARSYVAEMHSGFPSLRTQLSMDLSLRLKVQHLLPQTAQEIQRIVDMWSQALTQSDGPFLFGEFGIVDAFFAPVVFRFVCYGIEIQNAHVLRYMSRMKNHAAMKEWGAGAKKEKPFRSVFS